MNDASSLNHVRRSGRPSTCQSEVLGITVKLEAPPSLGVLSPQPTDPGPSEPDFAHCGKCT